MAWASAEGGDGRGVAFKDGGGGPVGDERGDDGSAAQLGDPLEPGFADAVDR
ncbi:MAG: hypothetical protein Q9226_006648, partial [Calogaya cf. arnoldii]